MTRHATNWENLDEGTTRFGTGVARADGQTMGIERFLKKSDGFESDEPIDPERVPPIDPDNSPGFGLPIAGGEVTVVPKSQLPKVAGLKELIRALRRRDVAMASGGDQVAVRAATADALEALRRVEIQLSDQSLAVDDES